jgi:hypothetical protein
MDKVQEFRSQFFFSSYLYIIDIGLERFEVVISESDILVLPSWQ